MFSVMTSSTPCARGAICTFGRPHQSTFPATSCAAATQGRRCRRGRGAAPPRAAATRRRCAPSPAWCARTLSCTRSAAGPAGRAAGLPAAQQPERIAAASQAMSQDGQLRHALPSLVLLDTAPLAPDRRGLAGARARGRARLHGVDLVQQRRARVLALPRQPRARDRQRVLALQPPPAAQVLRLARLAQPARAARRLAAALAPLASRPGHALPPCGSGPLRREAARAQQAKRASARGRVRRRRAPPRGPRTA